MPKEAFYCQHQVNSDGQSPDFTIGWGRHEATGSPHQDSAAPVLVNGLPFDRSGLNRFIKTLRKARDQVYGADQ